jgi:crotonobetainyl-CoA:carnitine CoA-transferase CaiB-like acyl-CoA transferase
LIWGLNKLESSRIAKQLMSKYLRVRLGGHRQPPARGGADRAVRPLGDFRRQVDRVEHAALRVMLQVPVPCASEGLLTPSTVHDVIRYRDTLFAIPKLDWRRLFMPMKKSADLPERAGPHDPRPGPLSGIRVLDLTTVVMGPAATQILGDLGADVIKVEQPGGDSMRGIGPFRHAGMGPMYLQANRNKRSVVLDLKSADGRAALLALAGSVDVVVSNIRPQAMQRLGIGYEQISAINPRVIFCAAVGYGSGGPDAGKAVYDDLMQAASGISGLFRAIDGAPRYAPVNLCDRVVGLYLAIAVLGALHHRHATGEGQEVEVPMFETMVQFVLADHMGGGVFVPPEGRMGYLRLLSRTRGPYATRNGHLSLVVYTDSHWRTFCELVGAGDLLDTDPRFRNQESRTRHAEEVGRFLAEHLATRTNEEWLALLVDADIPASPVNDIEDLFENRHLQAVDFFSDMEHPTEGTLKVARFPITFSKSPASVRRLAPGLGEHTQEVLDQIAAVATAGGRA